MMQTTLAKAEAKRRQPQSTSAATAASLSSTQNNSNKASNQNSHHKRRQLIGAIDQGTSSTRFLVFENRTGQLIASSQIEIQRIVPKEGWVEIDPVAIMDSVYATIACVHDQLTPANTAPGSPLREASELKCIGICNQRESTVVWDKITGKPLYNVIVWMDNRTKDLVDDMIDSAPGRDFNWLKDKTGLPMSTYFSAFKLKWLIDNVEEVQQALKEDRLLFGTVDSWILWNLTGKHLTDVSNASRTFLMDIESLSWDKSLCKLFNIPSQILPQILASADYFGNVQHGPLKGLPITGVIGDQSAALFGHNCLQPGQTKATFGTGCFIMQNIGPAPLNGALSGVQREAKRGLITTVGFRLRNSPAFYALEGSCKIAGAALTWLRDNLQLIENYEECDKLVNMTTNSSGVFFVPAFGGLYSPYWDPNAAGLFIGLSQFTRREHLVRATFDAISFQTNDILSLMRGVANGLMIDGGLCKSDNLCQILADITGCDIVRPSMCETSALGAAMVAGSGAGIWTFEEMLANSNTPYEYSCSSNQNHHYPHESLHYEDKFPHMISPKSFPNEQEGQSLTSAERGDDQERGASSLGAQSEPFCNLDAGGGVNDDAGGGRMTVDEALESCNNNNGSSSSSQLSAESQLDEEREEIITSGEFNSADSERCLENELQIIMPTNEQLQVIGDTDLQARLRHHATPSSGYSSGDNFELTTTNSCVGDLVRQDSPISSSRLTVETQSTSTEHHDHDHHRFLDRLNSGEQPESDTKSVVADDELSERGQNDDDDGQGENRAACSMPVLEHHRTFSYRFSNCLRNFIYPNFARATNTTTTRATTTTATTISDPTACDRLLNVNYEYDDIDYDVDDDMYEENNYDSASQYDQEQMGACLTKPVDVFQSYISLEHRTELVNTWRRAVERSMEWTKVHHEEIRRIDYQRLSSLPLSLYLFFSLGVIALSGVLSKGMLTK